MFEKVNPSHPDKVADRIAGAIVDLAYTAEENPKIAVEVLLGHGQVSNHHRNHGAFGETSNCKHRTSYCWQDGYRYCYRPTR